jgi:hypothetical protein
MHTNVYLCRCEFCTHYSVKELSLLIHVEKVKGTLLWLGNLKKRKVQLQKLVAYFSQVFMHLI